MLFSSLIFCFAFLPVALLSYFAFNKTKARNFILLALSLVFCAWGEPVYIAVLLLLTLFCQVFTYLTDTAKGSAEKKLWFTASVSVIAGSFIYLRYAAPVTEALNSVLGSSIIPVPDTYLPVGMAFYSLRLISYSADVYKGKTKAQRSFFRVLLYAGLFHLNYGGPIVKYSEIEASLSERKADFSDISSGITKFACGLAKKALLSDTCLTLSDSLLLTEGGAFTSGAFASTGGLSTLLGMIFFMLTIYFDFSAYSDMATGLGLIFGFRHNNNFNYPYNAHSISDFMSRWNISLGSFFNEYVFTPVVGKKSGAVRKIAGLLLTAVLTGMWYGSSVTFILWGLYIFTLLFIEGFVLRGFFDKHRILGRIYTLSAVFFGWFFFRFTELPVLFEAVKGFFGIGEAPLFTAAAFAALFRSLIFLAICIIAASPAMKYTKRSLMRAATESMAANYIYRITDILIPAVLLVLSAVALSGNSVSEFIFYQL